MSEEILLAPMLYSPSYPSPTSRDVTDKNDTILLRYNKFLMTANWLGTARACLTSSAAVGVGLEQRLQQQLDYVGCYQTN